MSTSGTCHLCSASTTWDDNVGSAVCTSCGSLEDSSQSVLTSSSYDFHNSTFEPSLWDSSSATTLKSLRAGNNWDLAGQGKESRDRKNSYAIAEFITSLAASFNAAGLSPRAVALFNQAKSVSHFRWGQKSKFTAAACLAIALRETNRPDSLRDIASMLDVPPAFVTREFTSITSTLNLNLSLVDPSVYMPTLQGHLAFALQDVHPNPLLPFTLVEDLRTLCLHSVANTATSLSRILARLSPEHSILHLPAAPTACGIFLLALEAEARSVLNSLSDLAEYLGVRCHTSKSVVMSRYKSVQDEVANWSEQVPWLKKYEKQGSRAKVSKRLVVARSLTDVILFQDSIWEQKVKPHLNLDFIEDQEGNTNTSQQPSLSSEIKPSSVASHATQFLLDPLNTPITSTKKAPVSAFVSHLPLAAHVLANPARASVYRHPTRLQVLALERGGVTTEHISDEDLFAKGEFERLLRSDDEIAVLRETLEWTTDDLDKDHEAGSCPSPTQNKRKHKDQAAPPPRKKSKLNMEAFAKLMAIGDQEDEDISMEAHIISSSSLGLVGFIDDLDEDSHITLQDNSHTPASLLSSEQEEGVIIQNWRSTSPDTAASDCRYEEECD